MEWPALQQSFRRTGSGSGIWHLASAVSRSGCHLPIKGPTLNPSSERDGGVLDDACRGARFLSAGRIGCVGPRERRCRGEGWFRLP